MLKILKSSTLFSMPSFMKGVARSIDLYGTIDEYNIADDGRETDTKALKRDWEMIGKDLYAAIKIYGSKVSNKTNS